MISDIRSAVQQLAPRTWYAFGNERKSGRPIRLTYIGNSFGFRTLAGKMFATGYSVKHGRRRWLGFSGVPAVIEPDDSDVFAVEIGATQWSARDNGRGFFVPFWLQTEIPVAAARRQMEQSSSVREDLRRIRKNGIVCESTTREVDIRKFYEEMYRPHTSERHGELSLPDQWERIVETVARGKLILARNSDGIVLGGITLQRDSDGVRTRSLGLSSRDPSVMNSGATSALYLASIEWAEACGFNTIGFGMTPPFLNDGLLQFKKKWGMRLTGEFGLGGGMWLRFSSTAAPVDSFLRNNPFLHVSEGKIWGISFASVPESLDSEQVVRLHTRYFVPGMNALQISFVTPGNNDGPIPRHLCPDLVSGSDRSYR